MKKVKLVKKQDFSSKLWVIAEVNEKQGFSNVVPETLSPTRSEAITRATGRTLTDPVRKQDWGHLYKLGFRAIPVGIYVEQAYWDRKDRRT